MKYIIVICVLIGMVSCNQSKESKEIAEEKNRAKFENKPDEKDAQFVVETASSLHTLIALTDVALEKNSAHAVATANKVKPELQNLLDEVEAYASAHVISIPTEATENSTREARRLLDEKPSEFDEKWCRKLRNTNKDFIGELESYGEKTSDLNIKTWLNSALPHARIIQDNLVDFENQLSQN